MLRRYAIAIGLATLVAGVLLASARIARADPQPPGNQTASPYHRAHYAHPRPTYLLHPA
jgi:hypothetical protein